MQPSISESTGSFQGSGGGQSLAVSTMRCQEGRGRLGQPFPSSWMPVWLMSPSLGSCYHHRPHCSLTGVFFLLVLAALFLVLVGFLLVPPWAALLEKGVCAASLAPGAAPGTW